MSRLHVAHPDALPAFMEWEPPTEYFAPVLNYGESLLSAWHARRCGICGRLPGRRFHALDHDHATGLVRGYLCTACNMREGLEPGGAFGRWRTGMNPCAMFGWTLAYEGHGYEPRAITRSEADAMIAAAEEWRRSEPLRMREAMARFSAGIERQLATGGGR